MLGSPLVGRRSCRGRPPEAAVGSLGRAGDRPVRGALADRLRGRGNRLSGDRPHHGMPTSPLSHRFTSGRKVAHGRDNRSRAPTWRFSCDAVSFYSCWGCLVFVVPTGPAQAITRGTHDDGRHPNVGELLFHVPDDVDAQVKDPGSWFTAGHCHGQTGPGRSSAVVTMARPAPLVSLPLNLQDGWLGGSTAPHTQPRAAPLGHGQDRVRRADHFT